MMKKLIYVMLFVAGISFTAANVSVAQDTKAKTCCNKGQTANADLKKGDCPLAAKSKSKADCPKNCPMADKKDCTKANCPLKSGAVSGKKSQAKTSPIAQAK